MYQIKQETTHAHTTVNPAKSSTGPSQGTTTTTVLDLVQTSRTQRLKSKQGGRGEDPEQTDPCCTSKSSAGQSGSSPDSALPHSLRYDTRGKSHDHKRQQADIITVRVEPTFGVSGTGLAGMTSLVLLARVYFSTS